LQTITPGCAGIKLRSVLRSKRGVQPTTRTGVVGDHDLAQHAADVRVRTA
jgi:hypothetical protein